MESVFFYGDKPENNSLNIEVGRMPLLKQFVARKKMVLSVEYVTDQDKITRFETLSSQHGFIPYAGIRNLDRLVIRNQSR